MPTKSKKGRHIRVLKPRTAYTDGSIYYFVAHSYYDNTAEVLMLSTIQKILKRTLVTQTRVVNNCDEISLEEFRNALTVIFDPINLRISIPPTALKGMAAKRTMITTTSKENNDESKE